MIERKKSISQTNAPMSQDLRLTLEKFGASPEDIAPPEYTIFGKPDRRIKVRIGTAKGKTDLEPNGAYKPHPKLELTTNTAGHGAKAPYPAMDSTNQYLNDIYRLGDQRYCEISVGNYGFTDMPMASFGFKYCDGLILRTPYWPQYRGFAHITSGDDPTEYVTNLLHLLGPIRVEAIIIAVKQDDKLSNILQSKGVKIIHTYDMPVSNKEESLIEKAYGRDIIVVPKEGKVIINIESLGITEIDF